MPQVVVLSPILGYSGIDLARAFIEQRFHVTVWTCRSIDGLEDVDLLAGPVFCAHGELHMIALFDSQSGNAIDRPVAGSGDLDPTELFVVSILILIDIDRLKIPKIYRIRTQGPSPSKKVRMKDL